jgi:hypothetical protein
VAQTFVATWLLACRLPPSKAINNAKDLKQRAELQNAEAKAKFKRLSAGACSCLMISILTCPSKLEPFSSFVNQISLPVASHLACKLA